MGRTANKSIISKVFYFGFQMLLAGCLLACAGQGGLDALGEGNSDGDSFVGGPLDLGGQNQAAPLTEGNVDGMTDYSNIHIQMTCSQSQCLNTPEIEGVNDAAEDDVNQCNFTYILKGQVLGGMAANTIAQVVDRDQNTFRYFKINSDSQFEFQLTLDTNPHVEFYLTDLNPTTPVSSHWSSCGADNCPVAAWKQMFLKFGDQSCDFLKSKPKPQIQLMKVSNSLLSHLQQQ